MCVEGGIFFQIQYCDSMFIKQRDDEIMPYFISLKKNATSVSFLYNCVQAVLDPGCTVASTQ